jgi:hypothetical protein
MTEAESTPLLQHLFTHQQRPEFTCRFRWEKGSLAFWDNRCAQHNPINDYHGFRRIMHRVTLARRPAALIPRAPRRQGLHRDGFSLPIGPILSSASEVYYRYTGAPSWRSTWRA